MSEFEQRGKGYRWQREKDCGKGLWMFKKNLINLQSNKSVLDYVSCMRKSLFDYKFQKNNRKRFIWNASRGFLIYKEIFVNEMYFSIFSFLLFLYKTIFEWKKEMIFFFCRILRFVERKSISQLFFLTKESHN